MASSNFAPRPAKRTGVNKPEIRSAGLLVDVVRTLTTSPSQAQKELQKERLEKDFAVTNHNVDRLLADHQQDLTSSLQTFRKVSSKLSTSRERVRSLKNNLSSCKTLLQCKRDELKQLWFEAAEQNRVVNLFKIIESVKSVPHEVEEAVTKHYFLRASLLLMEANSNIQKFLLNVEGLHDVRENIERKIKDTYDRILRELDKQIYIKPLEEMLSELKRVSSMRRASGSALGQPLDSSGDPHRPQGVADGQQPPYYGGRKNSSSHLSLPNSLRSLNNAYSKVCEDESPVLMDDGLVYEDLNDPAPDNNCVQYLAVLLEALGILGRLYDATNSMRQNMPKGLTKIVQHTTLFIYEHFSGTEPNTGDSRLLAELLQLLFRQFKSVAALHSYSANQISRVRRNAAAPVASSDEKGAAPRPYVQPSAAMDDAVWRDVQTALRRLLDDYLGTAILAPSFDGVARFGDRSTSTIVAPSADGVLGGDFSAFFGKRRATTSKKISLFKFDRTAHTLNARQCNVKERRLNADWSKGSDDSDYWTTMKSEEKFLVCPADPDNVTVVFRPLMRFIVEIESRVSPPCLLREYLEEFTREIYLPKISAETERQLDSALRHPDSWDALASQDELAVFGGLSIEPTGGAKRTPLLTCTLRAARTCQRFEILMQSAPSFLENFARLWLHVLDQYVQCAKSVYESSTGSWASHPNAIFVHQPANQTLSNEKRKISASWAADEDISRLLKSLPNWAALSDYSTPANMMTSSASNAAIYCNGVAPGSSPAANTPGSAPLEPQESAQQIRLRNQRESEILLGVLGTQKRIDENEVILEDFNRLRCLANMHESVEWLANQTRRSLNQMTPATVGKLKEATFTTLNSATNQQSFSNLFNQLEKSVDALRDCAATCLLMLHLEVRVHCFFYLLNLLTLRFGQWSGGGGSSGQEVDETVVKLNKNLTHFHEMCRTNLQHRKVKHIFEGLGHLIASIFINSCPQISKLNDLAKKRLFRNIFAIQNCLSSLTSSQEPDFDWTRRFFELLYKNSPDDILNEILENGPEFKESDYQNLLALFIRSNPNFAQEPGVLDRGLVRLKEILNQKRRR